MSLAGWVRMLTLSWLLAGASVSQERRFCRVLTWPPAVRVYQMNALGEPEYLGLSNGEPLEFRLEVEGPQWLGFEYQSPLPFRAMLDGWLGPASPPVDFSPQSPGQRSGWTGRYAVGDVIGPVSLPLGLVDRLLERLRPVAPWLGLLLAGLVIRAWRRGDRIRLQLVTLPGQVELVTRDEALERDFWGRWWVVRGRVAEVLSFEARCPGYLSAHVLIPRGRVMQARKLLKWPPEQPLRLLAEQDRQLWELNPGDQVGDCRVEERCGEGMSSVVYRASRAGEPVALKILKPASLRDAELMPRFRREMESLTRLRHPGIPMLLDLGEFHGLPFLCLEWLPGRSLQSLPLPLPLPRALEVLRQLAEALQYAHDQGVLHRDIKPANVMVDEHKAWLTDFGLARGLESRSITAEGVLLGTPAYMAPEVLLGSSASFASDRYGLACLAVEILAGSPPYAGDSPLALAMQHLQAPIARLEVAGLKGQVVDELERLLAKAPEQRPENLQALICALA